MPAVYVSSNVSGVSATTSGTLNYGTLASGQTIFLQIAAYGSGNVPSSVTDDKGNTYVQLYTQNFSTSFLGGLGGTITLYYATVKTAGNTTVTVNFASSTTWAMNAIWYLGFNTTPFTLETSASAGGTGTAPNSGATPSNATAGDLLLGLGMTDIAIGNFSNFYSAQGAGYSGSFSDSSGNNVSSIQEFQNAASTTTYSATATLQSSANWVMAVVAIKQTASVPTFVRGYGTVHSAGAGSLGLTGVTLSVGDLGIVCVKWVGTQTISTVADNLGGNVWIAVPNSYQTGAGNFSSQLWYCAKIATGGTATITVTWSATTGSMDIGGAEFTASTIDISSSSQLASSNNITISATPTSASEMLYAFFVGGASTPSILASGFTSAGAAGSFSTQGYMAAGPTGISYPATATQTAPSLFFAAIVALGPSSNSKTWNTDCYVFPFYNSKNWNTDCFVTVPQRSWNVDCYVANPSAITVALTYVSLAGQILFKINVPNGFIGLKGTLNQPVLTYVGLAATIKTQKLPASFTGLAGTIKIKPTPSYTSLKGTINNPTLKSWNSDCFVVVPARIYVSLAGTIVQKLTPTGPPVPTGAFPDSSYVGLRATILSGGSGSIQMPGSGYTTADDWYSSVDAGASYKSGSVFNLSGANLPAGGINLVVTAFTGGVTSFQTRTRNWLRRVDAANSGIVTNTQTNVHTLPNGAVITTTTVTTQNKDVLTTTVTTQSSATPTRTSTVITEKSVGGQTTVREIDTTTINGIVTNVEKKNVFSVPPTYDNPQPLKVTTLDGVIHYQFFSAINAEWAGGEQEGVTNIQTQVQIVPGTLNNSTTDAFGNPILSRVTTSTATTPDGKIITTTTTETGSSTAKDFGTTTVDTINQFNGVQKTVVTKTTYPDGSVVTSNKTTNLLTGDSTETDTETVTDEYGQVTTTVTSIDTKTFADPTTGIERQTVTKTVAVTKGGVTTIDTTVVTNNDFEDSIVSQKVKVYFIQEFTITCVIDELNLTALSELNVTLQKNYTLLELFGQQLGNAQLSWPLRNTLINQFNLANSSITPFKLQALGKVYNVIFAQSASAFRAKYIPGTEPHVYELQMILQSRSDISTGAFGF